MQIRNPKHKNHPLVQRFEGFIGKINGRLGEIQAEAAQGLQALTQQDPTDFMPLTNAFSGLDARVRQLSDKLDSTWDDAIEPKFEDADDSDLYDTGVWMKSDADLDMEWAWNRWKATQAANFYRNLAPLAQAELAKPRPCSQCTAALAVPDPTATQSVTCAACGAVNQVVPAKAVMTYNGAGHAFAEEKVVPLREEIERWRQEVDRAQEIKRMKNDDYSNEGVASLEKWESMERNYWTQYATVMAQTAGTAVDQALINARLKQFYMYTLEMEQDWVRKHGKKSESM